MFSAAYDLSAELSFPVLAVQETKAGFCVCVFFLLFNKVFFKGYLQQQF